MAEEAVSADLMSEVGDFIAEVSGHALARDGDTLSLVSKRGTELSSVTVESGTSDYDELSDKPSVNNVVLEGDKTSAQLGIVNQGVIPTQDIYSLFS